VRLFKAAMRQGFQEQVFIGKSEVKDSFDGLANKRLQLFPHGHCVVVFKIFLLTQLGDSLSEKRRRLIEFEDVAEDALLLTVVDYVRVALEVCMTVPREILLEDFGD